MTPPSVVEFRAAKNGNDDRDVFRFSFRWYVEFPIADCRRGRLRKRRHTGDDIDVFYVAVRIWGDLQNYAF